MARLAARLAVPATLQLALMAFVIALLIGIPADIVAS